ncbi:EthD family reductase [Mesorhizobium sp. M0814]|uniref:EthD family reductase n=1 Tax=Mesorhizobium sp. M0814 TaxID=2957004 RepID=UPI00333BC7DE
MTIIVAVYRTKNAEAFNRYYFPPTCHWPKGLPGLRKYEVSSSHVGLPIDPGGVHLVALLEFDSADDIRATLGTPEGQASQAISQICRSRC